LIRRRRIKNSLLAKGLGEVTVVGNDEDTTLEHLESLDKGSKRFTVKVVCKR